MARERRLPRQPDPRKRRGQRKSQPESSGKRNKGFKPNQKKSPGAAGERVMKKDEPHHSNKGYFRKGSGKNSDEHSPGAYPVKNRSYSRRSSKVKLSRESGVEETVRLNKFIANAGICSRREADDLIKAGVIKVNGKVITELGTKVKSSDKVYYGDQLLGYEKKRYILLNKQKGYVTTTRDPHAKNTVMELIAGACKERVYPVGRLDRNTTGLLLFTNDGELSKRLMHPSFRISKLYHVVLDHPLKKSDLEKIKSGLELEDGIAKVDSIAYDMTAKDKRELGVEIHSGKNRIIRRIFEAMDYKVVKLDRVMYAGLTKKNLPRGKWRILTEQEVRYLKRS